MSVRKLALAALCRVNSLRQSLAENRTPIVRGIAITAGLFLASGDNLAQAGGGHQLPPHDPLMLDADYQWFEPITAADLADLKPKKRANTGWYGGVDRLNLWLTRPENEQSDWLLDRGTGYRLDLGYMLDNDHGWAMSYMDFSVNASEGYDRERLNRYNLGALEGEPEVVGPPFGEVVPVSDDNNFGFNNRFVQVRNSENIADFRSLELNKTWRLEPYHYGGMLEPLVGVRYMRFIDTYQRMNYTTGLFPNPTTGIDDLLGGELVTTEQSQATNDLVGGQVGFRYFKFVDRFRYSAELRVFALGSYQSNRQQTFEELTLYDGDTVDPGDEVQHFISETNRPLYGKNNDFAWGFDIRSELSYTLSRMIELRSGIQVIDIEQGIWRGRLVDNTSSNQRALMAGLTFGVTLNR
ncbi:MAG TPA: hypothetical protein DDZ51_15790 [Planctomycetaceae bacterium]|nr:hypothetical protein [Planctomycetaceae bacterium]